MRLVNSFLTIIFLTITAPFHFLAASLPGRQSIATGWILNMLCNVLTFPAVMTVFYFIAFILGKSYGPLNITTTTSITSPSFALPLLSLDNSFIRILLAFGALIATPSIPDIICRTIGRVGPAGQLLGQEIGGNVRGGQGYLGQSQGRLGAVSQDVRGLFPSTGGPAWNPKLNNGAGGWAFPNVPGKAQKAWGIFKP